MLNTDSRKLGVPDFQKIGYVSENQEIPGWLSVRQYLDYLAPFYETWDRDFEKKMLSDFELEPKQKIRNLSRGMKMKVALVSSIVYRPRLLVLDEPFSGLDPLVRDEFIQGVLEITDREEWTIFLASHDIEEVERLSDTIGILNKGRLHLSESIESLLGRFRRVEVFSENAPETSPDSWKQLQTDKSKNKSGPIRFTESEWKDDDLLRKQITEAFGGDAKFESSGMTLREIFVALAREFRIQG